MMAHCGRKRFPHDDAERRKWQDPEAVLADIGLGPGQVFVDLGCGEGFFSIPASKIVGEQGRVYALDINSEAVESLHRFAEEHGLDNIVAQAGAAERRIMCEGCADFVFFGIDLHDFSNPAAVLRNAMVTLKPDGKLIDLDWKKEETPVGPPLEIRFDQQKAVGLIEGAGFRVESVADHGPWHYLITATPA
jgi:ubiquinone/menaquinone biosynthesis C-methylase UbiE